MSICQVSTEYSSTVISTGEEKNSSFDFMKPSWDIVSQAEGRVEHRWAGRELWRGHKYLRP